MPTNDATSPIPPESARLSSPSWAAEASGAPEPRAKTSSTGTAPLMRVRVRRDTKAWKVQVWVSFALAAALCATGLAWLPVSPIEQAFMVMGYVFCLSAVFVVSKYVRDQQTPGQDSPLWGVVVWSGFAAALGLTAWGMWHTGLAPAYKAYLTVGWLFLMSSAFTLAKMLRDAHDDERAEQR